MIKPILQRSQPWILVGLAILGFWMACSHPVQAGKVMKSLAFDTVDAVEVVTLYETSYSAQKGVTKSLKTSNKLMKKATGFKGSALLQSQDGKQVMLLSQWEDFASYQGYTPAAPVATSESPVVAPQPAQNLMLQVVAIQSAVPGATAAIRGKEAVVQVAQFTVKQPDSREQILPQLQTLMPQLLAKQPIPQSVLLLQEANTGKFVLLTNWNCIALFEDVGQPTPIALDSQLMALVDSDQQFYNLVNLMPGKAKKAGDKDDE